MLYDLVKFIEQANLKHQYKYNYSLVNDIVDEDTQVPIVCPVHGSFMVSLKQHLDGRGCLQCRLGKLSLAKETILNEWCFLAWQEAGEHSHKFDSYKLYLIRCEAKNGTEAFIKVGKTFTTLTDRFDTLEAMPYDYYLLDTVVHNPFAVSSMEHKVHQLLKSHKYIPSLAFAGMSECFTTEAEPLAIELFKKYNEKPRDID